MYVPNVHLRTHSVINSLIFTVSCIQVFRLISISLKGRLKVQLVFLKSQHLLSDITAISYSYHRAKMVVSQISLCDNCGQMLIFNDNRPRLYSCWYNIAAASVSRVYAVCLNLAFAACGFNQKEVPLLPLLASSKSLQIFLTANQSPLLGCPMYQ